MEKLHLDRELMNRGWVSLRKMIVLAEMVISKQEGGS